jgi:hypothetical protein
LYALALKKEPFAIDELKKIIKNEKYEYVVKQKNGS